MAHEMLLETFRAIAHRLEVATEKCTEANDEDDPAKLEEAIGELEDIRMTLAEQIAQLATVLAGDDG